MRIQLLAGLVFVAGCACASPGSPQPPQPPTPANLEVGRVEGERMLVHRDRMRWTFEDGGPIESIEAVLFGTGPYLERRGRSRVGDYRTEWIPIAVVKGRVRLFPRPVWYVVCFSPDCSGCRWDEDDGCTCLDQAKCTFGIEDNLFPAEVLVTM